MALQNQAEPWLLELPHELTGEQLQGLPARGGLRILSLRQRNHDPGPVPARSPCSPWLWLSPSSGNFSDAPPTSLQDSCSSGTHQLPPTMCNFPCSFLGWHPGLIFLLATNYGKTSTQEEICARTEILRASVHRAANPWRSHTDWCFKGG